MDKIHKKLIIALPYGLILGDNFTVFSQHLNVTKFM